MTQDGRLARGNESRRRILERAMATASQDGLEALSIGRLATDLGVSKSGVFAHFGSKEELQAAVIRAAGAVFAREVIAPGLNLPPGLPRLLGLCDGWLDYSQRRVFPGGCFFYAAGAEFDARPGRIRDLLADARRDWLRLCAQTVTDARHLGELTEAADPVQVAFELDALACAANSTALLLDEPLAYERARAGIRDRLRALATRPDSVP
ncbi:TetR/AcrR family transcriptional regulator [Actinocorallia sp. API 0066]|uniref:TetR/AcrR family transcriptional regulator n=1 Tax=Actinocorallia sp. API 0066 TaxID=2896846 RepID=UPI001E5F9942|nr:TetR/AcrR family transcriptional regulator [Actinocorallia sp. API 0066]MCD0453470.1 TetR/AcrR family transcriptional regulator [Actinocorallia sp. API 0066]